MNCRLAVPLRGHSIALRDGFALLIEKPEGELSLRITLLRRVIQKRQRASTVLLHAEAFQIEAAKFEFRARVALVGGLLVPTGGLDIIRYRGFCVSLRKLVLGLRIAGLSLRQQGWIHFGRLRGGDSQGNKQQGER